MSLKSIHGPGMLLCALGGIAAYAVYEGMVRLGFPSETGIFVGTTFSALYAEIMARVRKYPTICYLVVSIIPLIPGASLYHTMRLAADGAMDRFAAQGFFTAEETGIMAASIILVSSLVKIYMGWKQLRKGPRPSCKA